jgi:hypothetical protein
VKEKVNIINMSFGFEAESEEVKSALVLAHQNNVLVFAAMANSTNYKPAAWPAKELSLCIGIHSGTIGGHSCSDFTARPTEKNPNLMVVGERILLHWLTSKGGGFRYGQGTSFATPVAVSMGALVLTFQKQRRCEINLESIKSDVIISELYKPWGMASLFTRISTFVGNHYSSIEPELLWYKYEETDPKASRKYAWDLIEGALSPSRLYEEKLKWQGRLDV